jgi:flavodoxin
MQLNAQNQGTRKILIAYFSIPETSGTDNVDAVSGSSIQVVNGKVKGSVQFAAEYIQKVVGGDMFVIRTERPYPTVHNALTNYAKREQETNARPRLATRIESMQNYDTIFPGYPIWWYDLPMVLYSFLDQYDLSGKTIIPFTVHGGSRFSGTIEKNVRLEPGATVIQDGLAISRNNVANSERDIRTWLGRLGMAR